MRGAKNNIKFLNGIVSHVYSRHTPLQSRATYRTTHLPSSLLLLLCVPKDALR